MSVSLVRNRKQSYMLDGSIDMDNLPGRLGVVDTDRGVSMSKSNDLVATVVKVVCHWDGFDKKCGVGCGKLSGQLPAL